MRFTKDSFKRITPPEIVLCKASGERIGIIKTTEFTYDEALNDLNTIIFTTYLNIDNERNPYYDQIQEMMYIEFPKTERFVITNIDTESEGTAVEHKQVTAKSYEWMLSTRYLELFTINMGTTESIDGVDFRSLLHLCIDELFPEWRVGVIYGNLSTMQRSFEISKSTVYDFLMNDVATAFDCVFEFNSYDKTIDAYPKDMYGENAGVMISYENLLKHVATTLDVGQIKTSLVITGSDDVNIREVARGSDRIYNFSFYNSEEYMSQSLYNAYNRWQTLTYETPVNWNTVRNLTYVDGSGVTRPYFVFDNKKDLHGNYIMNFTTIQTNYQSFLRNNNYQDNYNNLYSFLLNTYQKYFTDVSEWTSSYIPAGNNRRYFGYGDYPEGYPNYTDQESTSTFSIEKYTAVKRVRSLPSSKDAKTLYLLDNDSYSMYRWYNNKWIDTNIWFVDSSSYPLYIALNPLKEKLKSAENGQANAMKQGYGTEEPVDKSDPKLVERYKENFIRNYLPYYYSVQKLTATLKNVQDKLNLATECQSRWSTAMAGISNMLSMANNFTIAQFKELSTFIREEELSSENYVVTDVMTEEERFEMLNALYEYGNKELKRVSQPQLTFTADIINLFNLPEFDRYSGYVVPGNYIMISLRDDYFIKPCITNIHYNFYDENDFSVTFSNVLKKGRDFYSDIQDALNEAHSISNSVSFNASYWSTQSRNADTITQHLAAGLLAAGNYLANGDDSELVMDSRGLFVTTVGDSPYANKDSIFIGGGRILFTEDNWTTVKMSVGRGDVMMPVITSTGITNFSEESKFGVFADFVMAGYVAGSIIAGGDLYSPNYKTTGLNPASSSVKTGNRGTHINLTDGTFEFNMDGGPNGTDETKQRKRMVLGSDGMLRVYGTIYAEAGKIGYDPNLDFPEQSTGGWTIGYSPKTDASLERAFIYSGNKKTIDTELGTVVVDGEQKPEPGIYIGTDGIGSGTVINYGTKTQPDKHCVFEVTPTGDIYANSATITGTIYANKGSFGNGTYKMIIGTSGENSCIYSDIDGVQKKSINENVDTGIYVGSNGIGLGGLVAYPDGNTRSKFAVSNTGKLYCQGAYVKGIIYATDGVFTGTVYAKEGSFGNGKYKMIIGTSKDSDNKTHSCIYSEIDTKKKNSFIKNVDKGIYIGDDGISLGPYVTYKYTKTSKPYGYLTSKHSNFEVDNAGNLYCQNAMISGTIYGSTITGTAIYSFQLKNGQPSNTYIKIDGGKFTLTNEGSGNEGFFRIQDTAEGNGYYVDFDQDSVAARYWDSENNKYQWENIEWSELLSLPGTVDNIQDAIGDLWKAIGKLTPTTSTTG